MIVFDAIVVGAGVAGCSAAIRLCQQGLEVLLIERESKPKHKVCGEFLSFECEELLSEVGVHLDDLGAAEISKLVLYQKNKQSKQSLPFVGRGISRKKLDHELQKVFVAQSGQLLLGKKVKEIRKKNGSFVVKCSDQKEFFTRSVFWATGKHDVSSVHRRSGNDHWVGMKRHLRLPKEIADSFEEKIEMHFFDGGYGGLSKVENGDLNFCFLLKKEKVKELKNDWQNILSHMSEGNPRLQEVFLQGEWLWAKPLAIAPIPYGYINEGSKDYFFIGDQMAVIPSITGDGMAMALVSAKEAVNSLTSGGRFSVELVRSYNLNMREKFLTQVRYGQWIQSFSQYSFFIRPALFMLDYFPRLVEKIITKTRCYPNKNSSLKNPLVSGDKPLSWRKEDHVH